MPVRGLGVRGRGGYVCRNASATCASHASVLAGSHAARGCAAGYSQRREMEGILEALREAMK